LVPADAPVLDLACGAGRHARFFAARGHAVTAVDQNAAALAELAGVPGVTTLQADLERAPWPFAAALEFGAIVVTHYLHRPLWPAIFDALAPGGILIYETFGVGQASIGKPSNPAFLLKPGELFETVHGRLHVVAYQDGYLDEPSPRYVQRLCAVSESGGNNGDVPRYDLAG
jgi:SAM-dependent methyltransferase